MNKVKYSLILALLFSSCGKGKVCNKQSEWRDHDGPDDCSFFHKTASCDRIIGKLMIRSRLHKNLFEPGVFKGGISSRWFEIKDDSIYYYSPNGTIAGKGQCSCLNAVLTIKWEIGTGLPEEAIIHFNDQENVELRYYDYPYSFDTFEYDTTQSATNPTKFIGRIVSN